MARLLLSLALLKTLIHLLTAQTFGFHRDELLYLALGRHLDWGYWSNPPFIGLVSWVTQHTLGDSLLAVRFFPAVCGGAFLWLVLRMVQEMGGGKWALIICTAAMFGSIAWWRAFSMLQPVSFDIFFWTLAAFFLVKWMRTRDDRWWWGIGAAIGLGMMNKYTLLFLGAALFLSFLLTPDRKMLLKKWPWIAILVAVALTLPNIWWQWQHDFPVVAHMQELRESQLENVSPVNFLLDQLLFHGPGVVIWGAGLVWLLRAKNAVSFRIMGWFFLAVIGLFLLLKGKSYYTIGAYPVLFSAGAVCWEKILQKNWSRTALAAAMLILPLPLMPYALPLMPPTQLVDYYQNIKIEGALRWEDGKVHQLPQDFADMLGWEELGRLTDEAIARAGGADSMMIYGENYGEASAAERFSLHRKGVNAVSFSDSYRLWLPQTLPSKTNTLVYINDELGEDVQALFQDIHLIGKIENPLAREKGTSVWLCRKPVRSFPDFWAERVK